MSPIDPETTPAGRAAPALEAAASEPLTPRRGSRRADPLGAVVVAIVAVLLGACGPGTEGDSPADEARTYTVRGAVRGTEGELTLQHEAIPDFVGPGGEVEPMHAMTMSFPVAPEVELGGLAPGDPVEIRLRVDWSASPPTLVTAVEALPEATELDLAGR